MTGTNGDPDLTEVVTLIQRVSETMIIKRWGITVAVLAGLGTSAVGLAAGQSPGAARRPSATAHVPAPAGLTSKAAFIYKCVTQRSSAGFKWLRIPWLTDLPEAIRQAKAEHRPILMWATDDDPLERC